MLKPRRFLLLFCLMLFISLQTPVFSKTAPLAPQVWEEAPLAPQIWGESISQPLSAPQDWEESNSKSPRIGGFRGQSTTEIVQNDPAAEAQRLFEEGLQLFQQGTAESLRQALQKWEQALSLWRKAVNKEWEAITLFSIGRIHDQLGEKQKALDNYNQALPLVQAVGNKLGEATTLNNIGTVYSVLGDKQKALDYYSQALSLSRAVGGKAGEAKALNNIGAAYDDLGDKQKALDYYSQALSLSRAVGDKVQEARTLNNIGKVYSNLGDEQKALNFYNQALSLSRAVSDKTGEATILNNIGAVYDALGNKQKALDYYSHSLPLSQAVGDKVGEARTLNNIGLVYDTLGDKQKALNFYNQALPLSKVVGYKAEEARILNNIGKVYSDLGDKQKALDYCSQALPLRKAVGDKAGEVATLGNVAYLEKNRGNLNAALTSIETAINIIEDLRTKIVSPELRQTYFATVQGYYEFYIDLLMQLHQQDPNKGYNAIALNASERSRARTLLELLTEANADIRTGVDPTLLAQEKTLQQKLDALEKRRIELYSNKDATQEQKTAIEQERKNLLVQYQDIKDQIRAKSPNYAALKYPTPLTLEQIQQQVLDDDTILLQYSLGQEHSYLWLVIKNSMSSYELPPRTEIEVIAQDFYQLLNNPNYDPIRGGLVVVPTEATLESASQLSQIVLAPVIDRLKAKRLLIVADGALQYIPFAALPVPNDRSNTLLLTQYEIVNSPSSTTLGVLRQQEKDKQIASKTIALFADPVFSADDARVNLTPQLLSLQGKGESDREGQGERSNIPQIQLDRATREMDIGNWIRLSGTRREAETILTMVDNSQQFHQFDFDANLTNATDSRLSQYRIVHFATHGMLNSESPELSGLVLSLVNQQGTSQNGFLRLHEIFNLSLPNTDLVVLSACQTGLGKSIQGEGLVGLTRGFMYAGAPRVVVSLWSVDDAATAEIMKRFYSLVLQEKLTPAQALRTAQLEMMQQTKWKSPYYWAAFTLQGEWR